MESTEPAHLHISIRAAHGCFVPNDVAQYLRTGHFAGTTAVVFVMNIPEEEQNLKVCLF